MGLEIALGNAWSEVTLVFFTTLAPSAAVAYLIMLIPLAAKGRRREEKDRVRKQLWIPLVLCMFGLIASATHLGNPSNALYVLSHIGGSPLSNEVTSAVAFLACAAAFWLCGFAIKKRKGFDAALGAAIVVLGAVFILAVAFAYNVGTIITWSQAAAPVGIVLSAFVAGPIIATFCLAACKSQSTGLRFERGYLLTSAAASALWIGCQAWYGASLGQACNSIFTAMDLVPFYWPCLGIAATLFAASFVLSGLKLLQSRRLPSIKRLCISASCALVAIFIMRFMFYMAHMTVGVAI